MTPIRPTGRDLSIKNPDTVYPLRFMGMGSTTPHTASETERDAMEWHAFALLCETARVLEKVAPSAFKYFRSQAQVITSRLGIGSQYEGAVTEKRGVWAVPAKGRHYAIEVNCAKKFRAEIFKKPAGADALANWPNVRDFLNLNANCTGPAEFPLAAKPVLDKARVSLGLLDTRQRMAFLTPQQAMLAKETHAAHHRVSAWRKDPANVPAPPPGIVQAAHDAFEASARDETELHFFQVKPFSGVEHRDWTRTELGYWASIQDAYHHQWMDGLLAGDWGAVRRADSAHLFAHLCMNFGPDCWTFLFPCPNEPHIDDCGDFTPRVVLPKLLDRLGIPA